MTVNHDVVGSSPTGGVRKRSKERFFYLSFRGQLDLFLFSSLVIFYIFDKLLIFDSLFSNVISLYYRNYIFFLLKCSIVHLICEFSLSIFYLAIHSDT